LSLGAVLLMLDNRLTWDNGRVKNSATFPTSSVQRAVVTDDGPSKW
jgi:hypothetical protein